MILAKSDGTTLQNHIKDLLKVFNELRETIPELSNKSDGNFWKWLFLACCFHDIGKSHNEFQKKLKGVINNWNRQRHELIQSLLFKN
jgi:CRISPR-associated endonuclease/helicase Cas3